MFERPQQARLTIVTVVMLRSPNISASYAISATASFGASKSISAKNWTFTEVTSSTLYPAVAHCR